MDRQTDWQAHQQTDIWDWFKKYITKSWQYSEPCKWKYIGLDSAIKLPQCKINYCIKRDFYSGTYYFQKLHRLSSGKIQGELTQPATTGLSEFWSFLKPPEAAILQAATLQLKQLSISVVLVFVLLHRLEKKSREHIKTLRKTESNNRTKHSIHLIH